MEHIVQFAVSIDDKRIEEICEESAAKQVIDDIKAFSHGTDYGGRINRDPEMLEAMFTTAIKEFVNEHADEIIDMAVAEVSKNFMRTKKAKEASKQLEKE